MMAFILILLYPLDCPHGQICVHCAQAPVNTLQRTCASLSKPFVSISTAAYINYGIALQLKEHLRCN